MLGLVAWLAVYVLLLWLLGMAADPWRSRRWFKAFFLPGTLLAIGLQQLAARACVGTRYKTSAFREGPCFSFDRTAQVPWLAGALFVVLSHVLLYSVFLLIAVRLDAAGWWNAGLVSLPGIEAEDALAGRIEIDLQGYIHGLEALGRQAARRPWTHLFVSWLLAGLFVSLPFTGQHCRWSLTALAILGGLTWLVHWFGVGFPFLSRGWWAGIFVFPDWWALFSLYFTGLLLTLCVLGTARGVPAAARRLRAGDERQR